MALADRRWHDAQGGRGWLLLLAGEAGIGKSRLLEEVTARTDAARRISAWAFPRDADFAGGLLLDLAAGMRRAGLAAPGDRMHDLLMDPAVRGDADGGRRLLDLELAELIVDALGPEPTVLALEDLHWADALSIDVLERVAVRLDATPALVIATFRNDELYPRSTLQAWRTRLVAQRRAEELRLPRLDPEETAAMVLAMTGEPPADRTVDLLQERSDGIPLHVEELTASGTDTIPDSISDGVVRRLAALGPEARQVAQAAAVIGRSFDTHLLGEVAGAGPDAVDDALAELAQHHVLERHPDGHRVDYRHALLRDAIYADIAPARRRELHAAVAAAAARAGFRAAFLSEHLERAGLAEAAHAAAMTAAAEAARISAHREAGELYRRAQRTQPGTTSPRERAELEERLAAELAASDENDAAAALLSSAIQRLRTLGDEPAAAPLVARLMAVRHLLGAEYAARAALAEESLERLGPEDPREPSVPHATLWAALAAAAMLDRRLDTAIDAGHRAAALVPDAGAEELRLDIDATLGAVLLFGGRGDEGLALLEGAIAAAVAAGLEAVAARGYRMLGTSASVLVEYERASVWLDAGVDYATRTERWNDVHYLSGHRAHVAWAVGDWTEADARARRALADGSDAVTTRVTALHVLGYLTLGRGQLELAAEHLTEARLIGETMGELQRLSPALWGLAELALANGDPDTAIELSELGYLESARVADAAYLFPYAVTGVRGRLARRDLTAAREWVARCEQLLTSRGIPGTLPAIDHARGLVELAAGRTGEARVLLERALDGWHARRRMWEGTGALIDLAACAARSRRPGAAATLLAKARAAAESMGASLLLDTIDGAASGAAASGVGPLSAREFEVARLIAAGATNREIAARLMIAPKTVNAHVEHILAKLGASRRTEIAAWTASVPE